MKQFYQLSVGAHRNVRNRNLLEVKFSTDTPFRGGSNFHSRTIRTRSRSPVIKNYSTKCSTIIILPRVGGESWISSRRKILPFVISLGSQIRRNDAIFEISPRISRVVSLAEIYFTLTGRKLVTHIDVPSPLPPSD